MISALQELDLDLDLDLDKADLRPPAPTWAGVEDATSNVTAPAADATAAACAARSTFIV